MKALIGIGDSWTQGVGGVPLEFFTRYSGRVDIPSYHQDYPELLQHELKNSWISCLGKKLSEYDTFNLGIRGSGNRGAVKELYLNKEIDWDQVEGGILIFMLSGRTRFDILSRHNCGDNRSKFTTLYPTNKFIEWHKNYYSDFMSEQETLLNILEAQTFAEAKNLKFFFCYAFDNLNDLQNKNEYGLCEKIEWANCLTPNTTYLNILSDLQNTPAEYHYYFEQSWPTKLVTNCVHPTIEGYEIIASQVYKKIWESWDNTNE